jgi:co-chaperonin GroES (HSP10)
MEAIGKYVVILPEKEVALKKDNKGLLIDKKTKEDIRYRKAEIIAIGSLVTGLNAGDKIFYDSIAGHQMEGGNEDFRIIKIDDIVVKL